MVLATGRSGVPSLLPDAAISAANVARFSASRLAAS
jgi:hypothetical protein